MDGIDPANGDMIDISVYTCYNIIFIITMDSDSNGMTMDSQS